MTWTVFVPDGGLTKYHICVQLAPVSVLQTRVLSLVRLTPLYVTEVTVAPSSITSTMSNLLFWVVVVCDQDNVEMFVPLPPYVPASNVTLGPLPLAVLKIISPDPPLPVPLLASKVRLAPAASVPVAAPPRTVRALGVPSLPRTTAVFVLSTVSRLLPLAFWTWNVFVLLLAARFFTSVLPLLSTVNRLAPRPLTACAWTPNNSPVIGLVLSFCSVKPALVLVISILGLAPAELL